jgi:hypothetical protein
VLAWLTGTDPRLPFYRFDNFGEMPFKVTDWVELGRIRFPWTIRSLHVVCAKHGDLRLVLRHRFEGYRGDDGIKPGFTERATLTMREGYDIQVRLQLIDMGLRESWASSPLTRQDITTMIAAAEAGGALPYVYMDDTLTKFRGAASADAIRKLATACGASR